MKRLSTGEKAKLGSLVNPCCVGSQSELFSLKTEEIGRARWWFLPILSVLIS